MNSTLNDERHPAAWYRMDFDIKTMSIKIILHNDVVEFIKLIDNLDEGASLYAERCPGALKIFADNTFGFDGAFKVTSGDVWTVLEASLPVMRPSTNPLSKEGYGRDLWMSMALLFNLLLPIFGSENQTRIPEIQMITMGSMGLDIGSGKAGFSVTFSPKMTEWFLTLPVGEIENVTNIMRLVDSFMWENNSARGVGVVARKRDNVLILSAPGDGCWMSGSQDFSGEGMDLDPHNVDNMLQMFTFFVGICVLLTQAESVVGDDL